MSYTIDFSDKPNNGSITVEDQTVNQEKSISFVGKNYTGYAKIIAENFLHILENFAKAEAPTNPVVGQLWYDTDVTSDPSQPQLKIWDGTTWTAAGNVQKAASAPLAANSVVGDIWADTANQQLYLWSGSNWILVGPQFSQGTLTGPKVEQIVDTLNNSRNVITFYINNNPVSIISEVEFTPKLSISGFSVIKKGFNLINTDSTTGVTSDDYSFFGTSANSSRLGGVLAANYLRSDQSSTTNQSFSIRNNSGLTLGTDLSFSLSNSDAGATILYNKTEGSSISIRTNKDGVSQDVITVSGTNVGINKTNPVDALDVVGKIRSNDAIIITGTTNATDLTTGSFRTAGGASIAKTLQVGEGLTVVGTTNTNSLIPTITNTYDIGSLNYPYRKLYVNEVNAVTFSGSFSGQLIGSVTGSASRLASATAFSLTGDVTSNTVNFNGQQTGGVATFTTAIGQDFITNKTAVASTLSDDTLLIHRNTVGLRKITVNSFLSTAGVLPVGSIIPYGGSVAPVGFLLCDGSEQLIQNYADLYNVIGYTYKPIGQLIGSGTFALPDLRGRFPLGPDNMNNGTYVPLAVGGSGTTTIDKNGNLSTTADRVTDVTADYIGSGSGEEEISLSVDQLPDHKHDLRGTTSTGAKGNQYYAIRNSADPITDIDVVPHTTNGPDAAGNGQYLTNSGGVDSAQLGNTINVMPPYQTINYIIFTGKFPV